MPTPLTRDDTEHGRTYYLGRAGAAGHGLRESYWPRMVAARALKEITVSIIQFVQSRIARGAMDHVSLYRVNKIARLFDTEISIEAKQ